MTDVQQDLPDVAQSHLIILDLLLDFLRLEHLKEHLERQGHLQIENWSELRIFRYVDEADEEVSQVCQHLLRFLRQLTRLARSSFQESEEFDFVAADLSTEGIKQRQRVLVLQILSIDVVL